MLDDPSNRRPDAALHEALANARALGFLGPGPVEGHIAHALRFAMALGERFTGPALDLGAGGGVPGLVLAHYHPAMPWVLLDSSQRRTAFLRSAAERLGLTEVEVITERAEEVARDAAHRGRYPLVVARGFGAPAVTAECGAPLLVVGGHLAVSEPPGGAPERWPGTGLDLLGLRNVESTDAGIWIGQLSRAPGGRYPRRTGVPTKRPLF